MRITLPVSGKRIEIVCPSYAQLQEVQSGIVSNVDDWLRAFYRDIDWNSLPSRDALLLLRVTIMYAMAEPVAAIKNLLAGGDGAQTSSGPITAPTAAD